MLPRTVRADSLSHGRPRTNSPERYGARRAPIGEVVRCVERTRRQLPKFPAMGPKEAVSRPDSEEGARNSSGAGHEKWRLLVDRYIQQFLLPGNEPSGVRCAQRCRIQRWSSTSAASGRAMNSPSRRSRTVPAKHLGNPKCASWMLVFPGMPWYRVAHPYFAVTNSVIFSPKTLAPRPAVLADVPSQRVSGITLPGFNPGSCREKFSYMLTATTKHERG